MLGETWCINEAVDVVFRISHIFSFTLLRFPLMYA